MNKQRFNNLINNYHNISEEDRRGLHELVKLYPYSQVLHILTAKANIDAKTDIAANTLNYAAMYATDRQVLKNIIQSKEIESIQPAKTDQSVKPVSIAKPDIVEPDKESTNERIQINQIKQVKITVNNEKLSEDSNLLRDEIWADLKNLKDSKANYLLWLEKSDLEESKQHTKKSTKVKVTAKSKTVKVDKKPSVAKKTVKLASTIKKETPAKKIKAQKAQKESKSIVSKEIKKEPEAKDKKIPVKQTTESKRQVKKSPLKEQIKIIDKFIDKIPSISSRQVLTINENQKDLSISSTEFGEDLVSENLALILVEQGKKQKAVDIYKKLIWKFPQKKAYFAAQIEALNK